MKYVHQCKHILWLNHKQAIERFVLLPNVLREHVFFLQSVCKLLTKLNHKYFISDYVRVL